MNMVPVESSNLKTVGYDKVAKTLAVEFHHGGVYEYYDVPAPVYERLLAAESKGKYFYAYIKGVYAYEKIR